MSPADLCGSASVFAGLPSATGPGRGVVATERIGLGIVGVTARKAHSETVRRHVRERFGIDLPNGPQRTCSDAVAAVGVAPESWWISCENANSDFAPSVRAAVGRYAAVVDLSDAYAVLRLSGPDLRAALAKLVPIDLHERRFKPGDVAQTVAAHMGVTLWRLSDGQTQRPTIEMCVGRSFAVSLYQALRESAAEFGFVFESDQNV